VKVRHVYVITIPKSRIRELPEEAIVEVELTEEEFKALLDSIQPSSTPTEAVEVTPERLSYTEMKEKIKQFLKQRGVADSSEIASFLGKHPSWVRRILLSMVIEGEVKRVGRTYRGYKYTLPAEKKTKEA